MKIEPLKWKCIYDSFRRNVTDTKETVECIVSDAGRATDRGELEEMRGEINSLTAIVARMAAMLPHEQQRELVAEFGAHMEVV